MSQSNSHLKNAVQRLMKKKIAVLCILTCICQMIDYRAYNIHIGAMFGSIMAFNVWFRIWPAQQKIITAITPKQIEMISIAEIPSMPSIKFVRLI